ncbi:amidase family protein [Streptomyces sp. Ac-502]|uniref:amidase family protein n=1 Tax=Streptomyces sp. Ac-502 TaxID=3342801 RepID=UPI0038624D34
MAPLRTAGGILVAGTNLPEFSYWTETADPLVSRTRVPWDSAAVSGASQELVPLQAAARLEQLDRLVGVPRGNDAGGGVADEDGVADGDRRDLPRISRGSSLPTAARSW